MSSQKQRQILRLAAIIFLMCVVAGCSLQLNPYSLQTDAFKLPVQAASISFGEISYDPRLNRVIVPAAETGNLLLIDPATTKIQQISGFSRETSPSPAVTGAVAAVSARGNLFVLDRSAKKLVIVDPAAGKITGSAALQAAPDDVAYISATNEIWVAEKALSQIEVLKLSDSNPLVAKPDGAIPIPDGPESLLVDRARGLVYTNQPNIGQTLVLQVNTRGVVAHWGNGCSQARGMAIDDDAGFLFVACQEGKLVVMDINNDGSQIGSQNYGGDLKYVAYNPQLRHVYLPSGASGILAVFALSKKVVKTATPTPGKANVGTGYPNGQTAGSGNIISLDRRGTADTALGAQCVTSDSQNNIWVCDPAHGQLFKIPDTFPPGDL